MKLENEIWAERDVLRRCINLTVLQRFPDGRMAVGEAVVMRVREEGAIGMYTPPTMQVSLSEAQMLVDELWRCGLRPTEGTGSAGSLAATERHLKDMQKIAFMLLEPQPDRYVVVSAGDVKQHRKALDALRDLYSVVIEQNRLGAKWHHPLFGRLQAALSDAAFVLQHEAERSTVDGT